MEHNRNEARDAGVLVFGRFVAMLAEAAMPFVIVRLLGKADVGAFTGLMLVNTTLTTLLTAGFPAAMLYFMANRGPQARAAIARRLFSTVMLLGVVIGGLLLVIGTYGDALLLAFGAWMSGDEGGEPAKLGALQAMALYPVFDVLARVFPNYQIAMNDSRGAALFGVLRAIGMTTGMLVPAALGFGLTGIVIGLSVFAMIQSVGIAAVVRAHSRGIARVPAEVAVGAMFRFAFPLGLTDIVNNLNAAIDRFAVLFLFSAAVLAEYRAGAWQIPVTTIAYSVGHVTMPRFVELLEDGKAREVIRLWRASVRKAGLVVVPVCMVFVVGAEEFMRLAFTDDYVAGAPVFRAYSIYTMGRVASFGVLILAAGRPGLLFRASLFTLLSNLVITVPLALTIGMIGPAVGTAIAFIPSVAVYCLYIARALGVRVSETFPLLHWLAVVLVATLAAVPAIAIKIVVAPTPALGLALYVATTIPGFVILARLTGLMTRDDLRFALGWLRLDFLAAGRPGA